MKTLKQITVACAVLLAFTLVAFAQVTNAVPGTTPAATNTVLVSLWNGLIVLVVPLVILGIKKLLPSLPKLTWPILATLLGVGADWLLAKSGMLPVSNWELGALCGAAGVGLREVAKQVTALFASEEPKAVTPAKPGS